MNKNDVDRQEETKIAMVEIHVGGIMVYSKAVFVEDIKNLENSINNALYYYDEAK